MGRMAELLPGVLSLCAVAMGVNAAETAMLRATVNGGEIEYTVRGDGDAVLFIHGVGLADAFAPIMAESALDSYRLIRMHRRGYAGSSEIEGTSFSMTDQAADVVALLDALGIERAHVVGHSYGGAVALQMAADAPERIHSLVLVDSVSPPGLTPSGPPSAAASEAPRANSGAEVASRARGFLATGDALGAVETFFLFVFGDDWRDYFDAIPGGLEQTVADAPVTFTIEDPALGEWQAVAYDTSAVDVPVLVLWGEESPLAGPTAPTVVAAFPEAEGRAIEGTDHALIIQKPAEVADAISDFLARHPI